MWKKFFPFFFFFNNFWIQFAFSSFWIDLTFDSYLIWLFYFLAQFERFNFFQFSFDFFHHFEICFFFFLSILFSFGLNTWISGENFRLVPYEWETIDVLSDLKSYKQFPIESLWNFSEGKFPGRLPFPVFHPYPSKSLRTHEYCTVLT